MPAAIENVRGIKIAINMTGIAIAISPQSRSRSGAKNLSVTKTSAGAVAKAGIDANSGARNKQQRNSA